MVSLFFERSAGSWPHGQAATPGGDRTPAVRPVRRAAGRARMALVLVPLPLLLLLADPAAADRASDEALLREFYAQVLSNPDTTGIEARLSRYCSADWVNVASSLGTGGMAEFARALPTFRAVFAELRWEVKEIVKDGDRYAVRSRILGRPVRPFFGRIPSGKSFSILSIDIHTVRGGKIVRSVQAHDWLSAVAQVRRDQKP